MADQDGATPTGVPAIPNLNDPSAHYDRATAMAAMAARRRETALADMEPEDAAALRAQPIPGAERGAAAAAAADPDDTSATDAAVEAERQRLAAAADQFDRQTAAPDPAPAADPPAKNTVFIDDADLANYRVRTKVNGEERVVGLDEMRATAQKTSAADAYLETAKTVLADTRAAVEQLRRQTDPNATAAPAADPSDTSSGPDDAEVAIQALFQGDEAKATAALRKLRAPQPGAGVDVGAIVRQVEQKLVLDNALRQFNKDHKQIAADPVARQIADRFLAEEMQRANVTRLEEAGADLVPQLLDAAGRRTADYFRTMAGVAPARTPPAMSTDRRAAKESIDEPPTAGARAASTVPTPSAPSDVIARMKEQRNPMRPPGQR
jgi:hypothetical protein